MTNINAYHRKDGRWEVRIYTHETAEKRSYCSVYGKTKEAAESKAAAFIKPIEVDAVTEMTVKEASEDYLSVKSPLLKESTAANYSMKLEKHIIPVLGELSVCAVKPQIVYAFMEELRQKGLSERYISDNVVLLRSIIRYAKATYGTDNKINGLIMPKKVKSETMILSDKEQDRLKEYIDGNLSRSTLGVAISLYTGVRIGELCALQNKDIDLEKRTLTVSKTIQRIQIKDFEKHTKLVITEPKSQSSKRVIPIPECLVEKIKAFTGNADEYIISGASKPVEPRTMQYRFARILKNVKLPSVHFHSLRAAFATNCVTIGFDIKTLSEILGHSSVELTLNCYVHSSMDRKKDCMNKLKWAA